MNRDTRVCECPTPLHINTENAELAEKSLLMNLLNLISDDNLFYFKLNLLISI
jgi:hypothetical protein